MQADHFYSRQRNFLFKWTIMFPKLLKKQPSPPKKQPLPPLKKKPSSPLHKAFVTTDTPLSYRSPSPLTRARGKDRGESPWCEGKAWWHRRQGTTRDLNQNQVQRVFRNPSINSLTCDLYRKSYFTLVCAKLGRLRNHYVVRAPFSAQL